MANIINKVNLEDNNNKDNRGDLAQIINRGHLCRLVNREGNLLCKIYRLIKIIVVNKDFF